MSRPGGDPPGFVRVLDERTLLLPERPGNRIADTLTNLVGDPRIALLFMIPGIGDTFRVNGQATIVEDRELLEPSAIEGKVPKLGILVSIEEAYTQCAKALIRSDLWNPERHTKRSELPSAGQIRRSLIGEDFDADDFDRERDARYARREWSVLSALGADLAATGRGPRRCARTAPAAGCPPTVPARPARPGALRAGPRVPHRRKLTPARDGAPAHPTAGENVVPG